MSQLNCCVVLVPISYTSHESGRTIDVSFLPFLALAAGYITLDGINQQLKLYLESPRCLAGVARNLPGLCQVFLVVVMWFFVRYLNCFGLDFSSQQTANARLETRVDMNRVCWREHWHTFFANVKQIIIFSSVVFFETLFGKSKCNVQMQSLSLYKNPSCINTIIQCIFNSRESSNKPRPHKRRKHKYKHMHKHKRSLYASEDGHNISISIRI